VSLRTWAFFACLGALLGSPVRGRAQVWTLDEDPVFEVGGLTADLDYSFARVVGGTRLEDGRVVIADQMENVLRLFSPEGVFLKEVGGEGQGPGEYEMIRGIARCEKDLITGYDLHWDENRYDRELEFVGTRRANLAPLGGAPYARACNPRGFVLATGWGDHTTDFAEGYFASLSPVVLVRGDEVVRDFGMRLGSERVGSVRNGQPTGSGPHPFGRSTRLALGQDRAFLGDGSAYRVEVYDLVGNRLPDITWTGPDLTYSEDAVGELANRRIEAAPERSRPALRRWFAALPALDRLPAYDRLVVDLIDNLWVRLFRRGTGGSETWVVFGRAGEQVGTVEIPARTRLLEAGSDYVLVSTLDDLDVPTVRVHRLVKER